MKVASELMSYLVKDKHFSLNRSVNCTNLVLRLPGALWSQQDDLLILMM